MRLYLMAAAASRRRLFGTACVRRAALRHVAIAAAARAQLLHRFFHQRAHIVARARASARRPAMAASLRNPAAPRIVRLCVSFCASILMKARSRSGKNCGNQLVPLFTAALCRCSAADLRGLQLGDFFQQAMLGLLRRVLPRPATCVTCCGSSQICVGKHRRRSVSVWKSRRAVRTARSPQTNSTRTPCFTFSILRSRSRANLPGAAHVGSAAGVQVEVANVDQPQASRVRPQEFCARPWRVLRQAWRSEYQPGGLRR